MIIDNKVAFEKINVLFPSWVKFVISFIYCKHRKTHIEGNGYFYVFSTRVYLLTLFNSTYENTLPKQVKIVVKTSKWCNIGQKHS